MSPPPDVSVVLPVYDGARYLAATIDSVLVQTGVDLELIVVDDGSSDDSLAIACACAARDPRVRVFERAHRGVTRSSADGCAEARGRYIVRMDVGDLCRPHRLRAQRDALNRHPDVTFVSCWSEFCGPDLEFLYLERGTGRSREPVDILPFEAPCAAIDGPTSQPSVMFRRDAYIRAGGYRAEFSAGGEDWDLWYRLAELGKFLMIEETLVQVRLHPESLSANTAAEQRALGELALTASLQRRAGRRDDEVLARAGAIRPAPADPAASARKRARWLYFVGSCLRRNGDRRAIGYLARAIRTHPSHVRSWVRLAQAAVTTMRTPW